MSTFDTLYGTIQTTLPLLGVDIVSGMAGEWLAGALPLGGATPMMAGARDGIIRWVADLGIAVWANMPAIGAAAASPV